MATRARVRDPSAGRPGSAAPALRRPIAVLVSRFPTVSETFILREIEELERQGQPVILATLIRERPAVLHPDARRWTERLLHRPFVSPAVAAANLRTLIRHPGRYLGTLARVVWLACPSWHFLVRSVALFPQAVWLSERLAAAGVRHVHAHFATHPTTAALVVARLCGSGFSFTAHAHDLFVRQRMLRGKVREAAFVRAISRFNRRFLAELWPESTAKTRVVHVGVATEDYGTTPPGRPSPGERAMEAGAAARPAAGEGAGARPASPLPTVLCVAGLRPYKGIPVLLAACRRLADRGVGFRCRIVGDGPLRRDVEREVTRLDLGGRVELLGARTQEDVARLVGDAAVCVAPGVVAPDGQMDGIPVFLMEAMAAARPVVASDLSGIPELVEPGVCGLLVPPGEAGALADALEVLLENPGLGERLGLEARRKVAREFELSRTTAELLRLIDRENPPPDPLVSARVRGLAEGWDGLSGPTLGIRAIRAGRDSRVVELLTPGPREVVVKIHASRPDASAPAPVRAEREHARLDRFHRWFRVGESTSPRAEVGPQRPGVPRPLHLDRERGVLVMERAPGRPLVELVRQARWSRGRGEAARGLRRALLASGAWLRRFQACPSEAREEGEALLDGLLARAEARLSSCGAFEETETAALARKLAALADRTTGRARRTVWRHGDFWPGNVLVDAERLHVVDFEGCRPGLPYADVADFVVHLELYFRLPLLAGRGSDAVGAFLEGFLGEVALDRAALRLFRAASALRLLESRAAPGSVRGTRGGWWEWRVLRRMVRVA